MASSHVKAVSFSRELRYTVVPEEMTNDYPEIKQLLIIFLCVCATPEPL